MRNTFSQIALATSLAAALLSTGALAHSASPLEPLYTASNQYTAVLDQAHQHWQVRPAEGAILDIQASACNASATIPAGLWLLVADESGQVELVAPSATVLPTGSPDHIALRDCASADSVATLAVPQLLIDLLKTNTGAIYVQP